MSADTLLVFQALAEGLPVALERYYAATNS